MSYYNYYDDDYPACVNLGVAGEVEIEVCVDVDIPYESIIDEMGDNVWEYVSEYLADHVLNNYKDYLPEILESACQDGLDDLCEALVGQLETDNREEMLSRLIRLANEAILRINNVEQLELVS